MPGLVKCRPDEVVHGRIDDDESLCRAGLHEDHLAHQHARLADQPPAGLEGQRAAQPCGFAGHHGQEVGDRGRLLVGINDPQAAADIEAVDAMAVGAQLPDQLAHPHDGVAIGIERGELRADMHGHAHHVEVGQAAGQREGLAREIDVDAELVLLAARRDLGVGLGIDVGIDADGDVGLHAELAGDGVQRLELGRALDVDLADARLQRGHQLRRLLADAGIDDALGRDAGRQRAAHLAYRDDVGAGAHLAEQADDRQVAVGLHGVADLGVHALDAVGEFLPGRAQRAGRIAVERRADLGGDGGERHAFGVHLAVLVGEEAHRPPCAPRKRRLRFLDGAHDIGRRGAAQALARIDRGLDGQHAIDAAVIFGSTACISASDSLSRSTPLSAAMPTSRPVT